LLLVIENLQSFSLSFASLFDFLLLFSAVIVGHHLHHHRVGDNHKRHEGENDESELPRIIKGDCEAASKRAEVHDSFADFSASSALDFSGVRGKSRGQVSGRVQMVVEVAHFEAQKLGERLFAQSSGELFAGETEHPAHHDETDKKGAEGEEHERPEKNRCSDKGLFIELKEES